MWFFYLIFFYKKWQIRILHEIYLKLPLLGSSNKVNYPLIESFDVKNNPVSKGWKYVIIRQFQAKRLIKVVDKSVKFRDIDI